METNTVIRIILSVVLSLFLLALIGRKTRENFESGSGSGSQIVGSVAENSEQFDSQSGFNIRNSPNPDVINAPSRQNIECSILTNNANSRAMEISKDLAEAKKQLKDHINKIKNKRQQQRVHIFDQGSNYHDSCKLMKYPALL